MAKLDTSQQNIIAKSAAKEQLCIPNGRLLRRVYTAVNGACNAYAFLLIVLFTFLIAAGALAQESPHGKIKFECTTCHSTETWKVKKNTFNHEVTGFALTGSHSNGQCESCHKGLKFAATKSSDCLSCHTDLHKSELGANCLRCHTTQTWKIADMVQKHQSTRFPLLGKHATLNCQTCHANVAQKQYRGTATDCFSCHKNDFAATKNPNHSFARFSTNCVQCHKVNAFTWGANFKHEETAFPLTGAHTATACADCHKNQVFKSTPSQCVSCHRPDYNRVTNPNHVAGNFPTNCLLCHTQTSYRPATFNHSTTQFPLTGAHQATPCTQCHVNGQYANTPMTCVGCHQANFTNAASPRHTSSASFNTNCVSCHTTTGWRPATFDHNTTGFGLTGRHASTQCQQCHTNNNYQIAFNNNCQQCHQTAWNQPQNPRHVTPSFSINCTPCHNTTVWRPSTFNHGTTRFALTGRHIGRGCNECHVNNIYRNLPSTCWDCHQNDFTRTTDPNHVQRNFNHECTQCHSTSGWDGAAFDHNTTNFPLTGRHVTTQCVQCHVNGNYQLQYTNCYPCHITQFVLPTSPNHVAGNFNHDCAPCHTTTVWRPSTFNHSNTAFQLVGAHQTVSCAQCHINNQFQNLPHTCWDCHATRFNTTTNPNHQTGQFNHDCLQCHTQSAWQPATFNHSTTNFPLTGAHVSTQCQQCHINGNYQLVYTNCYPCHQTQYNQPTNPRHILPSFAQNCTPCHNTTVWRPSTFSHSTTVFQLVGAHQSVACNQCHVNNQYQNLPHTCWDCHATRFNTTTNPNHQQGQFSHDCLTCHTQTAWQPATFNHSTTNFPLTGAHTTTQCQQCHINGNYQLQYTNCFPCHQTQYNQPASPRHVLPSFAHDCLPCHTTTVWQPSTFNHGNTNFQLTGAHQATACNQCHLNNVYQGTPRTCIGCHQTDFNGTTNPNHVARNFSQNCMDCHTTAAWSPATYNHNNSNFPLTGRHTTATCISCHVNNNYNLTYNDCYQCHATQFAQPTNPNHVTLQFSHNCTPCHTTTVWRPSTYNHDTQFFNIYSGKHRNRWNNNCASCHPSLGQYQIFTCTTSCHPQGEMDNEHRNRPGYVYSSPACYNCHRND